MNSRLYASNQLTLAQLEEEHEIQIIKPSIHLQPLFGLETKQDGNLFHMLLVSSLKYSVL